MTVLGIFRFLGLFLAGGIGFYRLRKNHLLPLESWVYWLNSLICIFMGFAFLNLEFSLLGSLETQFELTRLGWAFLVVSLIALQLYYRQHSTTTEK